VPHVFGATLRLSAAPGAERATVGFGVVDAIGTEEDRVPDRREIVTRGGAELRFVDRHGPPAHQLETLVGARTRDCGLRDSAVAVVVEIEECSGDPEAIGRHLCTQLVPRDAREETARERREDPGAVTGDAVGCNRATVSHAREATEGELDDLTAHVTARRRDETDAARIDLGLSQPRRVGSLRRQLRR
jgi:hypothetical protein